MTIRLKDNEAAPLIAINTTPLIDVMLVLLIMLIITIPVQLHSINMSTPHNMVSSRTITAPIMTITINASGQYKVNQRPVTQDALDQQLLSLSKSSNPPEIHIKPSGDSPFTNLAHILALAQNLKISKIGIDDTP
ncbi:MAG: biopolymer transporter ExbD [Ferrovum sp. 37-45-19]|jgi:biopolymer transport protein ExbD|uniref:ExbD/TolR family protein n=1 Tax=Ferrovum sp. JA12 TaxID=1356299 RepID=UPI000703BC3E|nr:biopolymer transporter ExbD [Ferrovum sp. JA12]OYV79178.1 MAG: biopolymer transporter ExbD [Ferrovum sp. 21-44-67]OYV93539.1 MAG: biopolymer transporter ExbD [Ferrovum sp. 37-45-19]OZB33322.1 MAG: biopolymer transporter ExbD [Ferrovum sp. 34-44-207]HQT81791.1 biopolymer transporter ExbD [Ferrovaceae bacterium]KRH79619.1 biopolymer transport protein ExbD [Ferrovum sp. JA12]